MLNTGEMGRYPSIKKTMFCLENELFRLENKSILNVHVEKQTNQISDEHSYAPNYLLQVSNPLISLTVSMTCNSNTSYKLGSMELGSETVMFYRVATYFQKIISVHSSSITSSFPGQKIFSSVINAMIIICQSQ